MATVRSVEKILETEMGFCALWPVVGKDCYDAIVKMDSEGTSRVIQFEHEMLGDAAAGVARLASSVGARGIDADFAGVSKAISRRDAYSGWVAAVI